MFILCKDIFSRPSVGLWLLPEPNCWRRWWGRGMPDIPAIVFPPLHLRLPLKAQHMWPGHYLCQHSTEPEEDGETCGKLWHLTNILDVYTSNTKYLPKNGSRKFSPLGVRLLARGQRSYQMFRKLFCPLLLGKTQIRLNNLRANNS